MKTEEMQRLSREIARLLSDNRAELAYLDEILMGSKRYLEVCLSEEDRENEEGSGRYDKAFEVRRAKL